MLDEHWILNIHCWTCTQCIAVDRRDPNLQNFGNERNSSDIGEGFRRYSTIVSFFCKNAFKAGIIEK